ncbi:hypothetical protein AALB53_09010 [Lachnospiraceae bacterium 47-T17]
MTRADFLKGSMLGALSLIFIAKYGIETANASVVTDNLTKVGNWVGTTPPASRSMTWTDTSDSGVMKYWTGAEWKPIRSTWDA